MNLNDLFIFRLSTKKTTVSPGHLVTVQHLNLIIIEPFAADWHLLQASIEFVNGYILSQTALIFPRSFWLNCVAIAARFVRRAGDPIVEPPA